MSPETGKIALAFARPAMLAGACLLGMETADAKAPPPVEKTLREIQREKPCSAKPAVSANEPDVIERMRRTGYAVPTDYCQPQVPFGVRWHMLRQDVSVTCGILYDVDRAGAPAFVEMRCDWKKKKGELEPEWRHYFQTLLTDIVQRASTRIKFEPAPDYETRDIRAGYMNWVMNAGAGEMPRYRRFVREGWQ